LFDAIQRAGTKDRDAVRKALASTDLDTVTGRVRFNTQHYSVALGGAQWRYDDAKKHLIKENVYNAVYPDVKKTAEMQLYKP
jgi:ABC-type branched-subunit amino acid transport system substrate-binding protein